MGDLFLTVLNMSLSASVVILAVLAARLVLRQAPKKWSYLLWAVVGFRLACPVSLESVFSIFRAAPVKPTVSQVAPVVGQAPASAIQYIPRTITSPPVSNVGTVPAVPAVSPTVTAPAAPAAATQVWLVAAIALWVVGMAVLLLYAAVTYWELRRSLMAATLLEGSVYEADGIRSPFILGLFRPKIYVPYGLDQATLGYVLDHERYHIRRGDHLWKTLAYVLLCVHWFNPLVWLSFHLMGRDMEMSCDEKVLRDNGNIRKAYSTTLLSFATERRFPTAAPLAFGETAVMSRIRNALNWKKPKTWATLLSALLCLALVVSCAVNPVEERVDPTPGNSEQEVKATGQYKSMEDYVNQRMADVKTVTYYSISGLLSSYSEAERELTAAVTGTKLARLEKKGELDGLAPEGTLECWEYNYLVQIDADPDDVSMLSGMYEEDGWFDLEGQGGHIVVALRYPDGSYDILGDQPKNDGFPFYGYHETVEESLYDWYVEEEGLDLPPYVKQELLQMYEQGAEKGYLTMGFHRYDGNGWYVYVPVQGWELQYVYDGGGAQWRSLYQNDGIYLGYFNVEPFKVGSWDPDAREGFSEGYRERIEYSADGTMGYRVFMTYDPTEYPYDDSGMNWAVTPELELMLNSFTVDGRFAKGAVADPMPMETAPGEGLTIPIPQEYRELLDIEYTADSVSLYEKRSREEFRADYPNGFDGQSADSAGMGWLGTIARVDAAAAREILHVDTGGQVFATDGAGSFYAFYFPTDLRLYRAGDVISPDNVGSWTELSEWAWTLPDAFLAQHPELTAITDEEARQLVGEEETSQEDPTGLEGLTGTELLNAVLAQLSSGSMEGVTLSLDPGNGQLSSWAGVIGWNGKAYEYSIANRFSYRLVSGEEVPSLVGQTRNTTRVQVDLSGQYALDFFEGTDLVELIDGDAISLFRAESAEEPDRFASDPYTMARLWFDECEFLGLGGDKSYYLTDPALTSPDQHLEAARRGCNEIENIHLAVSPGSSFKYTYQETFVYDDPEVTETMRQRGEIGENDWCFTTATVFIPENETADYMSIAGNTTDVKTYRAEMTELGIDPQLPDDLPEDASLYFRVGTVKQIRTDGEWTISIGGTG